MFSLYRVPSALEAGDKRRPFSFGGAGLRGSGPDQGTGRCSSCNPSDAAVGQPAPNSPAGSSCARGSASDLLGSRRGLTFADRTICFIGGAWRSGQCHRRQGLAAGHKEQAETDRWVSFK